MTDCEKGIQGQAGGARCGGTGVPCHDVFPLPCPPALPSSRPPHTVLITEVLKIEMKFT